MRKNIKWIILGVIILVILGIALARFTEREEIIRQIPEAQEIRLPEPEYRGELSVEEAIKSRRSIREYKDEPLTLAEVGQLLWAAQGITDPKGRKRAAPSAGALYPLEVYVTGKIEGLDQALWHYLPQNHSLVKVKNGDLRKDLAQVAFGQVWVEKAPVDLVFTAIYERTTQKYGEKGIRYVHMEAGHAAQNVYLQSESLGLGMVVVGGFDDGKVKEVLGLPENEDPMYIVPVGHKK